MLNYATLQGRLVFDPEFKKSPKDTSYCNFCVCSSEIIKKKEQKIFLWCTAWRKVAEIVYNNFKKGQEIIVSGKLIQYCWESDGVKRNIIKMNVDTVNFCGLRINKFSTSEFVVDTMTEEDFADILPEDYLPF